MCEAGDEPEQGGCGRPRREQRNPQQRGRCAVEQGEEDEDRRGKQGRGAHRRPLVRGELRLVFRQRHRHARFGHALVGQYAAVTEPL